MHRSGKKLDDFKSRSHRRQVPRCTRLHSQTRLALHFRQLTTANDLVIQRELLASLDSPSYNCKLLPKPHDSTALRCSRHLLAVRPGFVPSLSIARSCTQSRNSRTSALPILSSGTSLPHSLHLLNVDRYSTPVAGDSERAFK